jgi:hypothetical protein
MVEGVCGETGIASGEVETGSMLMAVQIISGGNALGKSGASDARRFPLIR